MKYSNQEAFDLVVTKLVAQGKPSIDRIYNICAYQNKEGNRCAAGHLIPDDMIGYVVNMRWTDLCEKIPELFDIADVTFVSMMQNIHDNAYTTSYGSTEKWRESWTSTMLFLATNYNLDPSKLLKLATQKWVENGT